MLIKLQKDKEERRRKKIDIIKDIGVITFEGKDNDGYYAIVEPYIKLPKNFGNVKAENNIHITITPKIRLDPEQEEVLKKEIREVLDKHKLKYAILLN